VNTIRNKPAMSIHRICATLLTLALFPALTAPARADSYYSSIGLGLPKYLVSTKASGMGGAGIGVMDRITLNSLNPATLNVQGMTTLGVNCEYEISDNQSNVGSAVTRYGNAMGVQFVVPVQKKVTLFLMLRPLTNSRYTLAYTSTDTTLEYTRTIKGDGGINAGVIGLQYNLKDRLFIAALANFNFGAFNEQWEYAFVDDAYRDATDAFNSHLWGFGYDLSLFYKLNSTFSIGGLYRSASRLNMATSIDLSSTTATESDSDRIKIDYPAAFGAGIAVNLKKWLFAADYYQQQWQEYAHDGKRVEGLESFQRFSLGAEYTDSRSRLEGYRRRISWRLGGYYSRLPFTNADGENVHETFLSFGCGLPFSVTAGQVDIAFEVGRRGDVSRFMYEDTIFRLSGSLTGGERWFQRRY